MAGTRSETNAGNLFSLKYDFVWCPKYRRKGLVGNVAVGLKALLAEKAGQLEVDIEALEIMPDHVHLFVAVDPTKAPQQLANQFKGYTSRVLRQEAVLWSRSDDVGSVGHVSEDTVRKSIKNQERRS
jgi:putative transposase